MKTIKVMFLIIFLAVMLMSCGSQKKVVGKDSIEMLKPAKESDIAEEEMTHNLEVVVSKVADNSFSNKNYFRLYVNKQLIQPQNKVDNTTSEYLYRLKLQPGYYDIKGIYYWNDGWKDVKTEIKNKDLVRVDNNGLTFLEKEIPKDGRGIVQGKNLMFNSSYTPNNQQNPDDMQISVGDTVPALNQSQSYLQSSNRVKFQINTDPIKCDVYINDELIGTSPISWWVERQRVHVVQVVAEGYRTGIRVVPPEEMYNKEQVVVILRLDELTANPPRQVINTGTNGNLNIQPKDTVSIDTTGGSIDNTP